MSILNRIKLIKGDITRCEADAIVNAANTTLLGGGGVDGAIHAAAGPGLLKECQELGGCPVGQAKITKGHKLKCNYIIHTVGPQWEEGNAQESILLAECYKNILQLAAKYNMKSVAIPCISTGAYQFPHDLACKVAIREVKNFLQENSTLQSISFVCLEEIDFKEYQKQLKILGSELPSFTNEDDL